jgi:hypothetical protein
MQKKTKAQVFVTADIVGDVHAVFSKVLRSIKNAGEGQG